MKLFQAPMNVQMAMAARAGLTIGSITAQNVFQYPHHQSNFFLEFKRNG
ncbi:MAG: hypothetical protein R2688_01185 [Fimbriimonadaceae bacterium]